MNEQVYSKQKNNNNKTPLPNTGCRDKGASICANQPPSNGPNKYGVCPWMEILVFIDISVLGFYGYIGYIRDISDISEIYRNL